MGLFVKEDGHYQGWLAGLLCLGCAVDDDEHPKAWREQATTQATVTSTPFTQEQHMLHAPPAYHVSEAQNALEPEQQHLPLATSPFEALNFNFDLPEKQTTPRLRSRNSTSPFRRLDSRESLRHSLVPLKLAPVVLRSPDVEDTSPAIEPASLEDVPPQTQKPPKESPFMRLRRESSYELENRQSQSLMSPSKDDLHGALSTNSSIASLKRSTNDDTASTLTSKSSTDLTTARVRRKHSGTLSLRADEAELAATDPTALELNTIIEEHKSDTPPRPTTAKSENHVPAVAPNMQVQARSETLNDIGSVFSRPLERKDAKALEDLLNEPDERRPRSSSQAARLRSRSSSRVSGWLNSVRTSNASSMGQTHTTDTSFSSSKPALPCHARGMSRVSRSSSVTMIDSESGTAASSPVVSRAPPGIRHVHDEEKPSGGCWCQHAGSEHVGVAL